jgi:hypothetical protein
VFAFSINKRHIGDNDMLVEQNGTNEVIISGNIKTLEESQRIKESISNLVAHGSRNIRLKINDSF